MRQMSFGLCLVNRHRKSKSRARQQESFCLNITGFGDNAFYGLNYYYSRVKEQPCEGVIIIIIVIHFLEDTRIYVSCRLAAAMNLQH